MVLVTAIVCANPETRACAQAKQTLIKQPVGAGNQLSFKPHLVIVSCGNRGFVKGHQYLLKRSTSNEKREILTRIPALVTP